MKDSVLRVRILESDLKELFKQVPELEQFEDILYLHSYKEVKKDEI